MICGQRHVCRWQGERQLTYNEIKKIHKGRCVCYQLRNMPTSIPQLTAYHLPKEGVSRGGICILHFVVLPARQCNEMWVGSPRYSGSAVIECRSSWKARGKSVWYFRVDVTKGPYFEIPEMNPWGESLREREGGEHYSLGHLFRWLVRLHCRCLHTGGRSLFTQQVHWEFFESFQAICLQYTQGVIVEHI